MRCLFSTTHDVIFFRLCFCCRADAASAIKTNDGINFQLVGISSNFAENVRFNRALHSRAIPERYQGTMLERPRKSAARKLPRPRLGTRAREPRVSLWFSIESLNRLATKAGYSLQKPSLSGTGAAEPRTTTDARSSWLWRSFIVLVLAPLITSSIYFGFLASDQFGSEMRFAVRGATEVLPGSDALAASGLGALTALNSNQDAYIVADYIASRSMIDDLPKEIDLRAIYSKPGIDRWAEFVASGAAEDLLRYWRGMVRTSVEAASGIVTVTVITFSREDSVRVATAIRARCDIVANQLLNRVRHDAVARANAEVKTAMAQLSARQASLEQFRNARMQIDPLALARSLGETITTLRRDLVGVEVKLDTAKASLNSDAPQIKMLAANRQILSDQIAALESRITGTNLASPTASVALAEYDKLDIEKSLAEQAAVLAERMLDNTKVDANRHHIYLVAIEDPTVPQSPIAPRRAHMILLISLGALSFWSLIAVTAANVRDHTI
jgi:capsular polysaccharide transport system permease protein